MNLNKLLIALPVLLILFSGCTFLNAVSNYKDTSIELINQIVKADYQKASEHFVHPKNGGEIPLDTFKQKIKPFRDLLVKNFGTDLTLSSVRVSKTAYKSGETGPFPTECFIQVKNKTNFGYCRVVFDDQSNKIISINLQSVNGPIPSLTLFLFLCIVPLIVLGFNIYTIRRVLKSSINKKWLRILMIVVLNVPAFTYSLLNGFSFELANIQILLGVSFGMIGYIDTCWTVGLPIGSLIVNYQITKNNVEVDLVEPTESLGNI
jgi:hypothetical protein